MAVKPGVAEKVIYNFCGLACENFI